jgi:RNA polymerase sigma-70 factor (ECF subfamily)
MGSQNRYEGLDEYSVRLIRRKAQQLVGRAGFVEADRHDLEQEFAVDLLRRMPRFDPNRAKRETFISRILEHRVATLVESQKAGVRDYRCNAGSLDEAAQGDGGDASDSPPVLDDPEYRRETAAASRRSEDLRALRVDLHRALANLPVELRSLCARLGNSTVSEVAREQGVSRSSVYEAIGRIRARLERAGLAAYLEREERSDRNRRTPVREGQAQRTRAIAQGGTR